MGRQEKLLEKGLDPDTPAMGKGLDPDAPVMGKGLDPDTPAMGKGLDPDAPAMGKGLDPDAPLLTCERALDTFLVQQRETFLEIISDRDLCEEEVQDELVS